MSSAESGESAPAVRRSGRLVHLKPSSAASAKDAAGSEPALPPRKSRGRGHVATDGAVAILRAQLALMQEQLQLQKRQQEEQFRILLERLPPALSSGAGAMAASVAASGASSGDAAQPVLSASTVAASGASFVDAAQPVLSASTVAASEASFGDAAKPVLPASTAAVPEAPNGAAGTVLFSSAVTSSGAPSAGVAGVASAALPVSAATLPTVLPASFGDLALASEAAFLPPAVADLFSRAVAAAASAAATAAASAAARPSVSSPSGSPEAERARQAEIAEVRRSCPPLKIPHCQGLSTEAFGLALFELIGAPTSPFANYNVRCERAGATPKHLADLLAVDDATNREVQRRYPACCDLLKLPDDTALIEYLLSETRKYVMFSALPAAELKRRLLIVNDSGTPSGFRQGLASMSREVDLLERTYESAHAHALAGERLLGSAVHAQSQELRTFLQRVCDVNSLRLDALGTTPLREFIKHLQHLADIRAVRLADNLLDGEEPDPRYTWLSSADLMKVLSIRSATAKSATGGAAVVAAISSPPVSGSGNATAAGKASGPCNFCKKVGHREEECRKKMQSLRSKKSASASSASAAGAPGSSREQNLLQLLQKQGPKQSGRCFKCGERGHHEKDCGSAKSAVVAAISSASQSQGAQVSGLRLVAPAMAGDLRAQVPVELFIDTGADVSCAFWDAVERVFGRPRDELLSLVGPPRVQYVSGPSSSDTRYPSDGTLVIPIELVYECIENATSGHGGTMYRRAG